MKTPKLILDYYRVSDMQLVFRSTNVVNMLTNNTNFQSTVPSLTNFTASQTVFIQALAKAATGDRTLIAIKNQKKEELAFAMRQLAMDIDAQANGDKAKLLSSGFELASPGEGIIALDPPSDFKIADGSNAGELKFSCKRVPAAVSYIFEYSEETPTEETQWKMEFASTREFTFKRLKSGTRIYGRIRAIGRRGLESNSDVLSRVVQ